MLCYVKESEILEGWSQTLYLRLHNPGFDTSLQQWICESLMFLGLIIAKPVAP